MLRRILQLLTLAAVVNLVYQYWPRDGGELVPVDNADKCGYVDMDGRVRIEFEWEYACPFQDDGLALVRKDMKYGVINKRGQEVIPPEWDHWVVDPGMYASPDMDWDKVSVFNEWGLIHLKKDGKFGWLNRQGETVIPAELISRSAHGCFFSLVARIVLTEHTLH